MTREEKQKAINALKISAPVMAVTQEEFTDYIQTLNKIMDWLEQEPTTKNDLGVDLISRAEVLKLMKDNWHTHNGDWAMQESIDDIRALPSVTPQEPKCKDCKWWKDSDGEYRRGCGAESKCPINRREVFEGNGYCYLFEPQESKDKESAHEENN